uniref:Uncharacterized protein n=1 Tax=Romanomermis culicivorax TaxID=13658 RepID=A0A915JIP9_ROMCU
MERYHKNYNDNEFSKQSILDATGLIENHMFALYADKIWSSARTYLGYCRRKCAKFKQKFGEKQFRDVDKLEARNSAVSSSSSLLSGKSNFPRWLPCLVAKNVEKMMGRLVKTLSLSAARLVPSDRRMLPQLLIVSLIR